MNPNHFLADLELKPDGLQRIAVALERGAINWPIAEVPERIVFVGMGSSLYAAQVAALRLRGVGITAVAESGSTVATWPARSTDLVVGISAGGGSVETNRLFSACAGTNRVALTNTVGSPITHGVPHVIDILAGTESSGVACRSFTHTLVALLQLEHQLTGGLPDLASTVLHAREATLDLLARRDEWLSEVTQLVAGPNGTWLLAPVERLCSAMQGALMLRETPRRAAVGCETGDWSHVDVYLTKTLDYRALVFTGSLWDANAAEWLGQRSATVVAVGDSFPGAAYALRYRHDDDPLVALLTEIMVPELIAATLWTNSFE